MPAPPFWMPTDPVLVIEGSRIEPARRNGPRQPDRRADRRRADRPAGGRRRHRQLDHRRRAAHRPGRRCPRRCRTGSPRPSARRPCSTRSAAPSSPAWPAVPRRPAWPPIWPQRSAVRARSTRRSRRDCSAPSGPPGTRAANPVQNVGTAPDSSSVTFTNAGQAAYAPDPVGWNTQPALPEFSTSRFDPYLPVWMLWSGSLDPLAPRRQRRGDVRRRDCHRPVRPGRHLARLRLSRPGELHDRHADRLHRRGRALQDGRWSAWSRRSTATSPSSPRTRPTRSWSTRATTWPASR